MCLYGHTFGRRLGSAAQFPPHFVGSVHIACLSSLEREKTLVCLWRPFSIARLCSLSLYIVKAFLNFGSVTVVRYSAAVYSLFRAKQQSSLQFFCSIFPMCQVILFLFSHDLVGSNCAVVLGLCGCVCVFEQSPRTGLLRFFSRFISLQVMALWWKVWESLPFRWLQNLIVESSGFWQSLIDDSKICI